MKAEIDIEQVLQQLGREWPAGGSIVDGVLRHIEAAPLGVKPRAGQWRPPRSLLAVAASLAVAAGLWWGLRGNNSLYAQALKAVHRARTFQMIINVVPPEGDKPAEQALASFYERGVGFREEQPGEVYIATGKHTWRFRKSANLVIRSKSEGIDDIIDRMLDREIGQVLKNAEYTRYEAGDQTVDGQACRAYRIVKFEGQVDPALTAGDRRMIALLDDQSRVVRIITEFRAGDDWVPRITNDWKYDVPLDRALFEPDFGDDVKIVDGDAAFDEFVSLDKALHREVRSGVIYAIHRVERFENGGIFLVSSVRGTADTLKKHPLAERMLGPGRYFVDGPAVNYQGSPQGVNGNFAIELASADHQGINVRWWVLVPRGMPPTVFDVGEGNVKIPVGFTPRGDFGKANFTDEKGVTHHVTWEIVLGVPRPKTLPTLDAVAREIYSDLALLKAVQFKFLNLGNKRYTVPSRWSDLGKVSVEEFVQGATGDVRWWYEQDVEFQLEGQFTPRVQEDAAKWGAQQTIALNYESLVNDATLERVAKHNSLKRLYLTGTKITDGGLRHLAGLGELEELNLAYTPITDAGLAHLTGLTALKTLNLEWTKVTADGIARLKAAIPDVKVKQ